VHLHVLALDGVFVRQREKSPWAAEVNGFNVHAGVMVRAGDREGLERLCRYGARPPFRLERMSLLPDGRVASLLRKLRRNGATHLVLDPVHFLARISALVPPPSYPLTRRAGVLAPHSTWRDAVVKTGAARPRRLWHPQPSAAEARVPSGPRTSLGAAIVKPVGARSGATSTSRRSSPVRAAAALQRRPRRDPPRAAIVIHAAV